MESGGGDEWAWGIRAPNLAAGGAVDEAAVHDSCAGPVTMTSFETRSTGVCHREPRVEIDLSVTPGSGGRRPLGEIDLNVPTSSQLLFGEIDFNVAPSSGGRRPLGEIDLNVPTTSGCWRILEENVANLPQSHAAPRAEIDFNVELPQEENDELIEATEDDSAFHDITSSNADENVHRSDVSNEKRRAIFEALLAKANNGMLKRNATGEISALFSVPIRTVQRVWKKGKACLNQGIPVDVSSGKCRSGRKKVEVDVSMLRDIPLSSRKTLADVCAHLHVSKGKLLAMQREGSIKRVSSTIKPYLTEKNKNDRLRWCIEMLDPMSIPNIPKFRGLFDFVFIDEKWFNITRKTERYYTVPGEEILTRTCKSKNFIPKIMILTALARPRFDSSGSCTFDGKIGCFPLVKYEAAKRSSINRPAGTLEMKPIESVTKDVIRAFLIEKILPAIKAKWPTEDICKPIFIQQDNAKPRIAPTDRLFCDVAKQDGFDIRLICQPANSPDLNILDLGFFNSLQSIQHKTASKKTSELVAAVDRAFQDYDVCMSNRIFLTLQSAMCAWSAKYRVPNSVTPWHVLLTIISVTHEVELHV